MRLKKVEPQKREITDKSKSCDSRGKSVVSTSNELAFNSSQKPKNFKYKAANPAYTIIWTNSL